MFSGQKYFQSLTRNNAEEDEVFSLPGYDHNRTPKF